MKTKQAEPVGVLVLAVAMDETADFRRANVEASQSERHRVLRLTEVSWAVAVVVDSLQAALQTISVAEVGVETDVVAEHSPVLAHHSPSRKDKHQQAPTPSVHQAQEQRTQVQLLAALLSHH